MSQLFAPGRPLRLAGLLLAALPHAAGFAASLPRLAAPGHHHCVATNINMEVTAGPEVEAVFGADSAAHFSSARVGAGADAPPSYDAVLEALIAVDEGDDAMAAFIQANRDLVDYRFLYRLTSQKLRASNLGEAEKAARLDAARVRAVKACQRFDAPLFKQVGEAETRLGGLLAGYMQGKPPKAKAVVAAAGEEAIEVFAFWMVLLAAIAAWESKLGVEAVEAQAREKLEQLTDLRRAIEDDAALMRRGDIDALPALLAEGDALDPETGAKRTSLNANARAVLQGLAPDPAARVALIRRVGCLYCQAQRHGFQAYNPMVQRAAALYDVLYYGEPQPLDPVDIARPEKTGYESGLVRMAAEAEGVMRDNGVEIPLFW